jgi:hypothetical protein
MELQTIRQRLESLKAEPPPPEAQALPWAAPQRSLAPSTSSSASVSLPLGNHRQGTAVNQAIATLKQRSGYSPLYDNSPAAKPSSLDAIAPTVGSDRESNGRPDTRPDLHRFEQQIQAVNELGQKQVLALTTLRQIAVQLEYELKLKGVESHPGLDAIATFFAQHDSATVPHVSQDPQGRLHLNYHTIDFYQAQHEAQTMAQALRDRNEHYNEYYQAPTQALFAPADPPGTDKLISAILRGWHQWVDHISQWFTPATAPPRHPAQRPPSRVRHPFTLLDATIWFSGAAIVRVGLTLMSGSNPALWPPLVMGAIALVAFALYRTLIAQRTSTGLGYKVLLILAGFLVGGRF